MAIRPALNLEGVDPQHRPGGNAGRLSVRVPHQSSTVDRMSGVPAASGEGGTATTEHARKLVAASVLARDGAGRVLLVLTSNEDGWALPGRLTEAGESPREAVADELRETLGMTIVVGPLLLVDWIGAHAAVAEQLVFVFDAGVLSANQLAVLRTVDGETARYEFVAPAEASRRLRGDAADRLARAITVAHLGATDYSERRR